MRRLAIASLILPIAGAVLFFFIVTGRFSVPQFPPEAVLRNLVASVGVKSLLVTLFYGCSLAGLGLAAFVLSAPVFGHERVGAPYAVLGLCASVLVLLLPWARGLGGWY
jgi:hypothetical protein